LTGSPRRPNPKLHILKKHWPRTCTGGVRSAFKTLRSVLPNYHALKVCVRGAGGLGEGEGGQLRGAKP
jgi:hypothetical protein